MSITVKGGNLKNAKNRLMDRLEAASSKAVLHAHSSFIRRMSRGIDHRGNPFKPYSKGYAKWKRAFGRERGKRARLNLGSLVVDHRLSGEMLNSFMIKTQRFKTKIVHIFYFLAGREKAIENQKRRNFVRLSTEELARIQLAVTQAVKNIDRG